MQHSIIYGLHAIEHALINNAHNFMELVVMQGSTNKRVLALAATAKQQHIIVRSIDKLQLKHYCNSEHHQGIAAKLAIAEITVTEEDLLALIETKPQALLLVLDSIQDPHNLGAILRTADAAGVSAVVVPQDNSVKLTPVVRKVACGAADTVPLVSVKNLARFLGIIKNLGMWVVGAKEQQPQTIYDVDLTGKIAIVVGAEGSGLRHLTSKHCDYLVSIPMYGQIESLNVSVAVGICLYEVIRQKLILQ